MCPMKMLPRMSSFLPASVFLPIRSNGAMHRQEFTRPAVAAVEELSVDGGKVRLRTPLKEQCIWRDYKVVRLHELVTEAAFQDNPALTGWVNDQPLATMVTCLGRWA